ncbi:hypothetical protein D7B42_03400 [Salmonella enterica]|uniref:hypothetical protein n=1 Tax=Citrobacter freundii TaxID=546 RepID=UPI000A3B6F23|nr:hypothetical protein [Citrobacter freundii]EAP1797307.1 hypothetical protein [Salmonella enterica]OUE52733.1 hypothetical protein AZ003_001624 [Citrobacter freundii]
MDIFEEMKEATLARIMKAKNLNTEEEWLEYYLQAHHFGLTTAAYDHFIDKPKLDLGIKFPDNIICVKTDDCFFPKQFQQNPCQEVVILDTNNQQVLYYLLCIGQADTVCPLSWRIAEPRYDEILSKIGLVILQYVLGQHILCIDHRNMYVGAIWYWHGVIRELSGKGYPVYSIVAPNRATNPIDLARARSMSQQDMRGNFIEKLASVDNYCFLIK